MSIPSTSSSQTAFPSSITVPQNPPPPPSPTPQPNLSDFLRRKTRSRSRSRSVSQPLHTALQLTQTSPQRTNPEMKEEGQTQSQKAHLKGERRSTSALEAFHPTMAPTTTTMTTTTTTTTAGKNTTENGLDTILEEESALMRELEETALDQQRDQSGERKGGDGDDDGFDEKWEEEFRVLKEREDDSDVVAAEDAVRASIAMDRDRSLEGKREQPRIQVGGREKSPTDDEKDFQWYKEREAFWKERGDEHHERACASLDKIEREDECRKQRRCRQFEEEYRDRAEKERLQRYGNPPGSVIPLPVVGKNAPGASRDEGEKTVENNDAASISQINKRSINANEKEQHDIPELSLSPSTQPQAAVQVEAGPSTSTLTATAHEDVDLSRSFQPHDWDDLETRFEAEMEKFREREGQLIGEFERWSSIFQAWATTGREWEEERGRKRLRTQIACMEIQEGQLEEKRLHYVKVMAAFREALALLM